MGFFDRFRRQDDVTRELARHRAENTASGPAETRAAQTTSTASGTFRLDDVFVITGRGVVVTGQVLTGAFRVGDHVQVMRGGVCVATSTVTGIEAFRKLLDRAEAGEHVGLLLRDIDRGRLAQGDQIHTR